MILIQFVCALQTNSRPVKLQFPDLQLGATQEGAWLVCRWAERTMLYSQALINRFIATTSQARAGAVLHFVK